MAAPERNPASLAGIYQRILGEGQFNATDRGTTTFIVPRSDPMRRRDVVILKEGQPVGFASRIITREGSLVKERVWRVFIQPSAQDPIRYAGYRENVTDGNEVLTLGFGANLDEEPNGRGASYDLQTGNLIEPYSTWDMPLAPSSSSEEPQLLIAPKQVKSRIRIVMSGTWKISEGQQYKETVDIPVHIDTAQTWKSLLKNEENLADPEMFIALFVQTGVLLRHQKVNTSIEAVRVLEKSRKN